MIDQFQLAQSAATSQFFGLNGLQMFVYFFFFTTPVSGDLAVAKSEAVWKFIFKAVQDRGVKNEIFLGATARKIHYDKLTAKKKKTQPKEQKKKKEEEDDGTSFPFECLISSITLQI